MRIYVPVVQCTMSDKGYKSKKEAFKELLRQVYKVYGDSVGYYLEAGHRDCYIEEFEVEDETV